MPRGTRRLSSAKTTKGTIRRVRLAELSRREVANGEDRVAQLCTLVSQFSGYGTQTAIWIQKLTEMGHEVIVSAYWGLSGSPSEWNGITILPGFGQAYCSASLSQHCKAVNPDLVITLGDIWVLDPNLLKALPVAHWVPCDCR